MIPQTQRWSRGPYFDEEGKQTDKGGDCFSACVASILEVPIEGFPNFLADVYNKSWWERWIDFLYKEYRCIPIYYEKDWPDVKLIAWWIAEVMIGEIRHSVVFYQDKFEWDPIKEPNKKIYTLDDVKSAILIFSIGSVFKDVQS